MTFADDLRYAFRMLARSPGFTAVALVTLALGIGANTAIFSVVNGVLLRELPYPEPERLVQLSERSTGFDSMAVAYPNFLDWERDNRSFEQIAAHRSEDFNLTGAGEPERLRGRMVSAALLPMLGVKPVLGRLFLREEDRVGARPAALLSESLWRRRFGGAADVLGKTVVLNGVAYTVVGVVPASFRLRGFHDVYVPLGAWDNISIRKRDFHPGIRAIARLKPGVTLEQARADMTALARRLAEEYPDSNKGHSVNIVALKDALVDNVRPALWVLLAAVGFVLLIACANVANLLLARSTRRRKEIAIRVALGAGRGRVIRQLLTESVLLAAAGAALGMALATWGVDLVLAAVPGGQLPRIEDIGTDWRVLAFTALAAVATGLLFGLAPALEASRSDTAITLKEQGRGTIGGRHGLRDALVVVEMALAVLLLAGAGLMLRSMWHLRDVNPGFRTRDLLTLQVALSPANATSPQAVRIAYPQLLDRISRINGVRSVAVTADLPLSDDSEVPFWVDGRPRPKSQGDMSWALMYPVSPDYLRVMAIPLLRGRFFDAHDTEKGRYVTVIDEVMARGLFGSQDPIGHALVMGVGGMEWRLEIVGVVGHVKHWGLDTDDTQKVRYQLYLPYLQVPDAFINDVANSSTFVIHSAANPQTLLTAVKGEVTGTGRDQPVYNVRTMEQVVAESVAHRQFSMLLLGTFAAIALALAAIGIYGVMSYSVGQRTREIGIRMALGAEEQHVLGMVVRHGAALAGAGIAIGMAAALVLTRAMSSMLFGVTATDPLTFLAASVVLAAAALLACYVPARSAAKIDPVTALRAE